MKLPKLTYSISKLLYYLCLALVGFVFVGTILTYFEFQYAVDIPLIEISADRSYSEIQFPFTEMYLSFKNRFTVMIMLLCFAFYAYYFYTLTQFFKVFTETLVFTHRSVLILKRFTQLNLAPLFAAIIYLIIELAEQSPIDYLGVFVVAVIHLLIALFVYFYLILIEKGKFIQDENNLTI